MNKYEEVLHEPGCCDGWSSFKSEINGVCPSCGEPTVNREAAYSCFYSPQTCKTCGHCACDGSCYGEE